MPTTPVIKLHNTMTRRKEVFTPIDAQNVQMYVCGPTVYDRAHLGNARPVIVFDVLYRLLRHVYGDEHVTYVRNFTDVDDRINETARKRKAAGEPGTLEELIRARSGETIQWYHEDMDALGAARPDAEPRATEFIGQMIAMISQLIDKSHAYVAEGHVLFAVDSWKEHYGALSGRSVDDMIAGARVEIAPYKRNPMDFVMWKPSTDDLPGWDSPWGRGRPGWHIECSAMAHELLGSEFDIHGGGNDLQFPHHENEIAQSRCAGHGFAKVWLHNEMLQVEGKKMSKSLGNFFTVRDVLDRGIPPEDGRVSGVEIRMAFLLSHYRNVMDFGTKRRHEAQMIVRELSRALGKGGEEARASLTFQQADIDSKFLEALSDDLNTSKAITRLRSLAKKMPHDPVQQKIRLSTICSSLLLLGFDLRDFKIAVETAESADEFRGVIKSAVNEVVELRDFKARIDSARATKDFSEADRLKEKLAEAGVQVQITKDGAKLSRLPNFDFAKLEALK